MSMLKFAVAQFEYIGNPENMEPTDNNSPSSKQAVSQFKRTIEAAKKALSRSTEFMYVRTRAIGALEKWGPNQNGDGFPLKELQASYKTFIGKGNFIDHKSDDITKIRGLVVDAFMNTDDQCIECLIAVDRVSHPQLCRDIQTGVVNSVSMGTRVGFSFCSVCNNRATNEKEYCTHISGYKGMKVSSFINDENHRFGQWPIHERNHDLEFIELSWVSVPAFKEANVLERLASLKTAIDSGKTLENSINVPEALRDAQESCQCKDTECEFDYRANNGNVEKVIKVAAGMLRIKLDVNEITFRKSFKDFVSKGTVMINEKPYNWSAFSSDKREWTINLEEDGADLLSSHGNKQIHDAINQMLNKNIDTSELIVSSNNSNIKTGYLHSQQEDPLMKVTLEDRAKDSKKRAKSIYDMKDLEVPSGRPVRESEDEAFAQTAKEGPSGALGKSLSKGNETMDKEELDYKKMLHRAYMKFLMTKEG